MDTNNMQDDTSHLDLLVFKISGREFGINVAKVQEIIAQTGASSMKDMGKEMGLATKTFAGKADNKEVSDMVKRLLSQQ